MGKKYYSEIIDLKSKEFTSQSLHPGALIDRFWENIFANFAFHYWDIFNRLADRKITFETLSFILKNNPVPISFPKNRRMLFQSDISTFLNKKMLKADVIMFQSHSPFEEVATCSAVLKEALFDDAHSLMGGITMAGAGIGEELEEIIPAEKRFIPERITGQLNRLKAKGKWLGPVETQHTAIFDYCHYVQLAVFFSFFSPVMNIGRHKLLKWIEAEYPETHHRKLSQKLDFTNWQMWASLSQSMYLSDDFTVESYYMETDGKIYLKHEIYRKRPRLTSNLILEEFTI